MCTAALFFWIGITVIASVLYTCVYMTYTYNVCVHVQCIIRVHVNVISMCLSFRERRYSISFHRLRRTYCATSSGSCPPIRARYSSETRCPSATSVTSTLATHCSYLLVSGMYVMTQRNVIALGSLFIHVHVCVGHVELCSLIVGRMDSCSANSTGLSGVWR